MINEELKKLHLAHYQSYDKILEAQEYNFQNHLQRLTVNDKQRWFGDITVNCLADLSKLPITTGEDIIQEQQSRPPYGMWDKGQIVFTSSSANANGVRKVFSRNLSNHYRGIVSTARSLENHGIDHTDVILTTDTGSMFCGHVVIEDPAILFCGATRVRCGSPLLTEKIKTMAQFGVTVFSSSPSKLYRMSKLQPKTMLLQPLKMLISTGGKLEHEEEIAEAFGVERVINMYGSSEMYNVAWTCRHGHFHVNIDLCYIEDGKYFNNLTNLPIFKYVQGDEIHFSYKGTCACGSNLPTVDTLEVSNSNRTHKD